MLRLLREWSDGSRACCTRAWGTVRVLGRVVEGDGRAGGVGFLRRKMLLLLLPRIKTCILLLISGYETASLRTPDPILRMDPVWRLMMAWLVAHPIHWPLMTHSIPQLLLLLLISHPIPQLLTTHPLSKLPCIHPLLLSQLSSIHTIHHHRLLMLLLTIPHRPLMPIHHPLLLLLLLPIQPPHPTPLLLTMSTRRRRRRNHANTPIIININRRSHRGEYPCFPLYGRSGGSRGFS